MPFLKMMCLKFSLTIPKIILEIFLKTLSGFPASNLLRRSSKRSVRGFPRSSLGRCTNYEIDVRARAQRMPKSFTGNWSDHERSKKWRRSREAKDWWCTDEEHDATLVKATAKKRLPCRTECRSRQAEDYLNRLCGPKREGAEKETRRQLRRRRGSTTSRYLYVVPLETQWPRPGTSLFMSTNKTHRMPLIFFDHRLEFTGRAATGINSLIGKKIWETERNKEREKKKRGLISCASEIEDLYSLNTSLCISWVVKIIARSNLRFRFISLFITT